MMSWSNRLAFLVLPLVLTLNAYGHKLQFGVGNKANLQVHTVQSREHSGISSVELDLSVPVIDVSSATDGFSSLQVPGLTVNQQFGNPDVLSTGSLIAVPNGFTPAVTVLSQKQEVVPDVVVQPSQPKLRCSSSFDGFSFNNALYQSGTTYPSQIVSIEEVGYLQSVHLMRVAMNPVQQDFGKHSLNVTTQLKVRIDFVQTGRGSTQVVPESIAKVIQASTANGLDLQNRIRGASAPEILMVFVADSLKDAISPYVQWKQQRGYDVRVITFTEAGGSKDAVKSYIQKFYDSAEVKPSHLLFVGNNTTMPTHFTSTGSGSAAGDYTYALLAGGSTDLIPDVTYARLAADNAEEVGVQIRRWIAYEKEARSEDWYPQAMTLASNEGSNPSDKEYALQIQDALKVGTYKTFDSFFQGEQTATAANITEGLGKGRTWIAYFGHGTGTSWGSTNDSFAVQQVDEQTNVGKLPVIIDVACQNANWVKISKSFAKAWVMNEKEGQAAGAVAFYGGSVNISWHPPAVMSVGVAKTHFEKGINVLGSNVLAGQLYLVEKMGNSNQTIDNIRWYNLLGDPALLMRTDIPKEIRVKVAKAIRNGRSSVTVTVTDANGAAIENLTASAAKADRGTLAVAKTDNMGQAVLNLDGVGSLEGTQLTITGYNTMTHQETL